MVIERAKHVYRLAPFALDYTGTSTCRQKFVNLYRSNPRLISRTIQRKRAEDAPEASTSTTRSTRSSARTSKSNDAPAHKKSQPVKKSVKKVTTEISSDEVRVQPSRIQHLLTMTRVPHLLPRKPKRPHQRRQPRKLRQSRKSSPRQHTVHRGFIYCILIPNRNVINSDNK